MGYKLSVAVAEDKGRFQGGHSRRLFLVINRVRRVWGLFQWPKSDGMSEKVYFNNIGYVFLQFQIDSHCFSNPYSSDEHDMLFLARRENDDVLDLD